MSYIIDDIYNLIPTTYQKYTVSMPNNPGDLTQVDCALIILESDIPISKTLDNYIDDITCNIQVFIRGSDTTTYDKLYDDLITLRGTIYSYINQSLGDNKIINVTNGQLLPLGINDNDQYEFSLNLTIIYKY